MRYSVVRRRPGVRQTPCWLALVFLALMPRGTCAQASPLTQCTQAFYAGDYSLAEHRAQTYLHTHPANVPVRIVLARAELAQGRPLNAFAELKRALADDPKNIDALYYLSLVSRQLSRSEYERLFSMAPDSFRVHQLLAESALGAQNPAEAEDQFKKALEQNPHSAEVLLSLAELKRSQSKFDEAISYYTQAGQNGVLSYDIAYGLGACYTYKQDYPEAVQWLRKAAALAPDLAAGRFALANALYQLGQFEAAIAELQASLRLEPRMRQAYFLLGRAYAKLGRQEEAKAAVRKLDELNRADVPAQAPERAAPPGRND